MRTRIRNLQSLAAADTGSVSILFGMTCVVLMVITGIAIDTSRFYNLSSRMQDSVDEAALAGAKMLVDDTLSDGDIEDLTRTHFNQSMTVTGVKANKIDPLDVKIDRANSAVEAVSKVTVASFFGKLANAQSEVTIERKARVVYEIKNIELSMVLDITGSMNGATSTGTRISDMKSAATTVIDSMMAESQSEKNVRIAIAPFSASVNAGALASAVSAAPATNICDKEGEQCHDVAGADVDTCVLERTNGHAATDDAPVGADILPSVPSTPYGNYVCPPASVVPLLGRSKVGNLDNIINGYAAAGSTAGHIGAAWGWYLLSPKWSSVLPNGSVPAAYSDSNTNKSIIFMTDGIFNTSYLNGSATSSAVQADESYAQFDTLCTNAKAAGITIYTVAFTVTDPRAVSELTSCASGASNFYSAPDGPALKAAFGKIAKKLTELRVAS